MVQLECGSIAQILEILDMPNNGDCHVRMWILNIENMIVQNIEIPNICKVTSITKQAVVPLSNICSRVILLEFEDKTYACKPPNVIESS